MNNHKNSRTTVHNRETIVRCVIQENVRPSDVARDLDIGVRTVHKWLRRHRDEGSAGLESRSSAAIALWYRLSNYVKPPQFIIRAIREAQYVTYPTIRRLAKKRTELMHLFPSSFL